MSTKLLFFFLSILCLTGQAQNKAKTTGPVFDEFGAVYPIDNPDFQVDPSQHLYAIFDIDRSQKDPAAQNSIISSLHRYYNLHVQGGIPKENIHLSLVLHGGSTRNALKSSVYKDKFGVDNPNEKLLASLSEIGVELFVCGQSVSYSGYNKNELLPNVKLAPSAMTVLTVFQMKNYALIKF